MKKHRFITLLVILLSLTLNSNMFAQGSDDDGVGGTDESCPLCVCLSDNSCSANADCDGGSPLNCTTTTFTVPCSKVYTIHAWVDCTSGACYKCQSCVTIKNGVTTLINCHNGLCDMQDCDDLCSQYLEVGITYTLIVCKVYCPVAQSCTNCASTCTAHGCVYRDVIACP